jgi:hypothetical protein
MAWVLHPQSKTVLLADANVVSTFRRAVEPVLLPQAKKNPEILTCVGLPDFLNRQKWWVVWDSNLRPIG